MKNNFKECIECKKRYPGCHGHCEIYQQNKIAFENEKQVIKKVTSDINEASSYYLERDNARLHRDHVTGMRKKRGH